MNHDGPTDPLPREETVEELSSQSETTDEQLFNFMILEEIRAMCNDYMVEIIDEDLRGRKYEKSSDETEICVICMHKLKNSEEASKLKCGHCYHFECIKKWLIVKNMCPLCKKEGLGSDNEDDGPENDGPGEDIGEVRGEVVASG